MPRILIADDDPAILSLLRQVLTGAGHAVETAPDGMQAFDALRRAPPDLVITDIHMPGLNGFELLSRAREGGCRAPFLIITGAPTETAAPAADRCGSVGVLPKPLDLDALVRRVRDHVAAAAAPPRTARPVLVADDDPAVRKLLDRFLADAGYRVDVAADGAEAVARARAAPEPYFFAFVDIRMPRLEGPRAIAEMARLRPETLYILITGEGTRDEIRHGFREGGYTLLRKPFDLEAILRALPSYEAAAAELREKVGAERALQAQPAHRKAIRWVRDNVLSPSDARRRFRVRTVVLCVIAAVAGVLLLRVGTAAYDRWQGEESTLGGFFDRIESYLRRGEGYLQRDENRELRRERGPRSPGE